MTDTHDYLAPSAGTQDWHEPLNENFQRAFADIAALSWRTSRLAGGLSRTPVSDGFEYARPDEGSADWDAVLDDNFASIGTDLTAIAARVTDLDGGEIDTYEYQTPAEDALDWHEPLNAAFEDVAADVTALSDRLAALEAGSGGRTVAVAVGTGTWSDPTIWAREHVPAGSDDALVTSRSSVEFDATTPRLSWVRVEGEFAVDPGVDTHLRADTIVASQGSTVAFGTADAPIDAGRESRVTFLDTGPIDETVDPRRVSRGLVAHGDVSVHGAPKTSWVELADHPTAGDTGLALSSAPTNWRAGDEIVVPDLTSYDSADLDHDDERRAITAVDGSTVGLDAPLEHDHVPPRSDLPSYVVNLTRNVRFVSEGDDADRYGHCMLTEPDQTLAYLETVDLGRTEKARDPTVPNWDRGTPEPASPPNPRARYSIHFHRTGPTEPPHVVRGCSVRGSPGWGVVNHGSNLVCEDSVTYECLGAGFVAESGREVGRFQGNFALRSAGSGENTESRKGWSNAHPNRFAGAPHNVDDFGHSGHGFWIHSPLVEVEGNVAGGHRHTPITFWTRALHEQPLDRDADGEFVEHLDGKHDTFPKLEWSLLTEFERRYARTGEEDPVVGDRYHDGGADRVYGTSLPMRTFENNVAFGCGGGFDLRGGLSFRNQQSELHRRVHSGNRSFNTGEFWLADGTAHGREDFHSSGNVGLDHRYVGNLLARNYRLVGTGDGVGVYNNSTYIDDFHVEGSVVENWDVGLVPSHYTDDSRTDVRDVDFSDNDVDVRLPGRFGDDGRVVAEGNTYSGTTDLEWEEIFVANMIPRRFTAPVQSNVRFEGRTVYHGWSDPAFVVVREGDDERLEKMMNHGNERRWRDVLDGDDPRSVLPGTTHQELYDEYGITFYGGIRDPDAPDSERPDSFAGGGGTYDSTPFLGPASKTMPTDEIWIDAVEHMSFSGDHEVHQYGDGVPNEEPLSLANDRTVVELRRAGDRSWDPPVEDGEGVAAYTFEVDRPGTYQIHLRCQQGETNGGVGSGDNNSQFFTRIDGGPWRIQDGGDGLAPTDDLVWPITGQGPRRWTEHDVRSTGEHTVEIAGKGAAMRLDWVLIEHETCGANAAGSGKPHTPR